MDAALTPLFNCFRRTDRSKNPHPSATLRRALFSISRKGYELKKHIASVMAVFGLLAGMLLAATGTASATGGTTSPTFDCANVIGVGQICDNVDNVIVTITDLTLLNGNNLVKVEDVLNHLAITGIDGDVTLIKGDVLNLYHNDFSIPILSNNVIVIGWPTCGC
jgi:hypothetical protein